MVQLQEGARGAIAGGGAHRSERCKHARENHACLLPQGASCLREGIQNTYLHNQHVQTRCSPHTLQRTHVLQHAQMHTPEASKTYCSAHTAANARSHIRLRRSLHRLQGRLSLRLTHTALRQHSSQSITLTPWHLQAQKSVPALLPPSSCPPFQRPWPAHPWCLSH